MVILVHGDMSMLGEHVCLFIGYSKCIIVKLVSVWPSETSLATAV